MSALIDAIVAGLCEGVSASNEYVVLQSGLALRWMISSGMTKSSTVRWVVDKLLCAVLPSAKDSADSVLWDTRKREVVLSLRVTSQRHPVLLDSRMTSAMSQCTDASEKDWLMDFLREAFDSPSLAHHTPLDDNGSLFMSLSHASPVIRASALKRFAEVLPASDCLSNASSDLVELALIASNCLADRDTGTALAAWSAPVLSRIAALAHPSALAAALYNSFLRWGNSLRTRPNRSSTVVRQALDCFGLEEVQSSFAALDGLLPDGSTGSDWLTAVVLSFLVTDKPELKDLRSAAVSAAISLGAADSVALFAGFKFDGDLENFSRESIAKSICKNMMTWSSVSANEIPVMQQLSRLVTKVRNTLLKKPSDVTYMEEMEQSAVMLLLYDICVVLSKQHVAVPVLEGVLEATISLLLLRLRQTVTTSTPKPAAGGREQSLSDLSSMLSSCIAILGHVKEQAGETISSAVNLIPLVSLIAKPLTSDLRFRILVALLGAASEMASLLEKCVELLFAVDAIPTFLRVARSPFLRNVQLPSDINGSLLSGSQVTRRAGQDCNQLHITTACRCAALYALASYVTCVNKYAAKASLDARTSNYLFVCSVALLSALGDQQPSVRRAALAVFRALSDIPTTVVLRLKVDDGDANLRSMRMIEIIALAQIICDAEVAILSDASALDSILATHVFRMTSVQSDTKSSKNKDKFELERLQTGLLSLAQLFGWDAPDLALPVFKACSAMSLERSWAVIQQAIYVAHGQSNLQSNTLASTLIDCIKGVGVVDAHLSANLIDEISVWVINIVQFSKSQDDIQRFLRVRTLDLLASGWSQRAMTTPRREQLYRTLINVQALTPGFDGVLQALNGMEANLKLLSEIAKEAMNDFMTSYRVSPLLSSAMVEAAVDGSGHEEDAMELEVSGLAAPLQQLCSVLEVLRVPFLDQVHRREVRTNEDVADDAPIEAIMTLGAQSFSVLSTLCDVRLRTVLILEYSQGLLHEYLIGICAMWKSILKARNDEEATLNTKKSKRRASKQIQAGDSSALSTLKMTDVSTYLDPVLKCLERARTGHVRRVSLKLLRILAEIQPSALLDSLPALGGMLSTAGVAKGLVVDGKDREELMHEMLKTFVEVLSRTQEQVSENDVCLYVLQSLFLHIKSLPTSRRSSLVSLAVESLGDRCLTACVAVLLVHVWSAHESSVDGKALADHDSNKDGDADAAEEGQILLSRSAQRKAGQVLRISLSEELFNLAMSVIVARQPPLALRSLIEIVQMAVANLNILIGGEASVVAPISSVASEAMTTGLQKYAMEMIGAEELAGSDGAQALMLVFLDFVKEALEHRSLHVTVAKSFEHSEEESTGLRETLIEVAESFLQVITP